jgi:hypothetical protein
VLYCILSVTSDPNSDMTRCFSTLLGRYTVLLNISVSARCVVYGPAPLHHSTPFIIECLFSVVKKILRICEVSDSHLDLVIFLCFTASLHVFAL